MTDPTNTSRVSSIDGVRVPARALGDLACPSCGGTLSQPFRHFEPTGTLYTWRRRASCGHAIEYGDAVHGQREGTLFVVVEECSKSDELDVETELVLSSAEEPTPAEVEEISRTDAIADNLVAGIRAKRKPGKRARRLKPGQTITAAGFVKLSALTDRELAVLVSIIRARAGGAPAAAATLSKRQTAKLSKLDLIVEERVAGDVMLRVVPTQLALLSLSAWVTTTTSAKRFARVADEVAAAKRKGAR